MSSNHRNSSKGNIRSGRTVIASLPMTEDDDSRKKMGNSTTVAASSAKPSSGMMDMFSAAATVHSLVRDSAPSRSSPSSASSSASTTSSNGASEASSTPTSLQSSLIFSMNHPSETTIEEDAKSKPRKMLKKRKVREEQEQEDMDINKNRKQKHREEGRKTNVMKSDTTTTLASCCDDDNNNRGSDLFSLLVEAAVAREQELEEGQEEAQKMDKTETWDGVVSPTATDKGADSEDDDDTEHPMEEKQQVRPLSSLSTSSQDSRSLVASALQKYTQGYSELQQEHEQRETRKHEKDGCEISAVEASTTPSSSKKRRRKKGPSPSSGAATAPTGASTTLLRMTHSPPSEGNREQEETEKNNEKRKKKQSTSHASYNPTAEAIGIDLHHGDGAIPVQVQTSPVKDRKKSRTEPTAPNKRCSSLKKPPPPSSSSAAAVDVRRVANSPGADTHDGRNAPKPPPPPSSSKVPTAEEAGTAATVPTTAASAGSGTSPGSNSSSSSGGSHTQQQQQQQFLLKPPGTSIIDLRRAVIHYCYTKAFPDERETSALMAAIRAAPVVVERESDPFRFLRFEGGDVRAASKRLLSYWKVRRRLFRDRYSLPVNRTGTTGIFRKEQVAKLTRHDQSRDIFLTDSASGTSQILFFTTPAVYSDESSLTSSAAAAIAEVASQGSTVQKAESSDLPWFLHHMFYMLHLVMQGQDDRPLLVVQYCPESPSSRSSEEMKAKVKSEKILSRLLRATPVNLQAFICLSAPASKDTLNDSTNALAQEKNLKNGLKLSCPYHKFVGRSPEDFLQMLKQHDCSNEELSNTLRVKMREVQVLNTVQAELKPTGETRRSVVKTLPVTCTSGPTKSSQRKRGSTSSGVAAKKNCTNGKGSNSEQSKEKKRKAMVAYVQERQKQRKKDLCQLKGLCENLSNTNLALKREEVRLLELLAKAKDTIVSSQSSELFDTLKPFLDQETKEVNVPSNAATVQPSPTALDANILQFLQSHISGCSHIPSPLQTEKSNGPDIAANSSMPANMIFPNITLPAVPRDELPATVNDASLLQSIILSSLKTQESATGNVQMVNTGDHCGHMGGLADINPAQNNSARLLSQISGSISQNMCQRNSELSSLIGPTTTTKAPYVPATQALPDPTSSRPPDALEKQLCDLVSTGGITLDQASALLSALVGQQSQGGL